MFRASAVTCGASSSRSSSTARAATRGQEIVPQMTRLNMTWPARNSTAPPITIQLVAARPTAAGWFSTS